MIDPYDFVKEIPAPVGGALMSFVVALLRILYDRDGTPWQRIGIESLLCGAISFGACSGLQYFSLPAGVSVFVGSMIGLLGVEFVRAVARRSINKRVS